MKYKARNWQCHLKSCTSITGFKKAVYNALKVSNAQLVPAYNRRKHKLSHINLITNQINRLSKTFGYISTNKINAWIGLTLTKFSLSYQVGLLVPKNGLIKQIEQNVSAKTHFAKQIKNQKLNTLQKTFFGQNKSEYFLNNAYLGTRRCVSISPSRPSQEQEPPYRRPRGSFFQRRNTGNDHVFQRITDQEPKQMFKLIIRNVPSLIALIESECILIYWKNNVFKSLNATKQALRHKQLMKVNCLKQTQNAAQQFKLKKVNAYYAWLKVGEVLRQ